MRGLRTTTVTFVAGALLGGAAGAFGRPWNLTRPPVAFSTSFAQFACQIDR